MLLGLFWGLGLFAHFPAAVALTVSRSYLLVRNAVWSAGAFLLAILLLRGDRRTVPLSIGFSILWLLWRTADRLLLQNVPFSLPGLLLPAVPTALFVSLLFTQRARRWLAARPTELER